MSTRKKIDSQKVLPNTSDTGDWEQSDTFVEAAESLGLPPRVVADVRLKYNALIEGDYSEEQAIRILNRAAPTTFEEMKLFEHEKRREAQKQEVMHALRTGKQRSRALYLDIEHWKEVSNDAAYAGKQHDLETTDTNINEILRDVGHQGAKKFRFVEMGPGTGEKPKRLSRKLLSNMKLDRAHLGPEKLVAFDLHSADVSPEMLFGTFMLILNDTLKGIRSLNTDIIGENHPWREFVEFLEHAEKENGEKPQYTESSGLAAISVQKAFYKYLRGKLVGHDKRSFVQSLLKFSLARYFGIKKNDHKLLFELDRDIKLPFEMYPHQTTFEDLDGSEFRTTRTVSTLYNHAGNEAMNQFPGKTVKETYAENLCRDTPEMIKETEAIGEGRIRATYVLFSFQTNKEGEKILNGYNIPSFNKFVSHLFASSTSPDDPNLVTLIDPTDKSSKKAKILKNEKCYKIEASYEEDPDNPGFFGTVHRLVFTRDVNVMVNPENKPPQIYPKNKGDKIMLLPSYKPSVEQMIALCEENGLKVVKIYLNEDGTNAVFLIRRKTKEERDAVGRESSGTRDAVTDVMEGETEEDADSGSHKKTAARRKRRKRRKGLAA